MKFILKKKMFFKANAKYLPKSMEKQTGIIITFQKRLICSQNVGNAKEKL